MRFIKIYLSLFNGKEFKGHILDIIRLLSKMTSIVLEIASSISMVIIYPFIILGEAINEYDKNKKNK